MTALGDDLGNDGMKDAVGDPHGGGMIISERGGISVLLLSPQLDFQDFSIGVFFTLARSDKVRQGP